MEREKVTSRTPGIADRAGPNSRVRLGILFSTVFIDLVGFGIVLPLLPFYADRFGATGTVIGLLVLSYAAVQLVLAPFWGWASDRVGRRPILLVGLVGSAVSYVIFAYAGSVAMLLLSRVLAGVVGANVPVAQAYIADITRPGERAGAMGLIGAAFGLGFIFGPALGGILFTLSPEVPGLVAAVLCLLNAVLAWFFLPESLDPEDRSRHAASRQATPTLPISARIRAIFDNPEFGRVLALTFLFTVAFATLHPTFSLFAARRFGMDERGVGWVFAFMGTVSAIVQGGLVRILAPRLGEVLLVRVSSLFFAAGLLVLAGAPSVPILYLGVAILALGFGGTLPALVSLLSQAAPPEVQGGSLGIGQSVGSLGRVCGPLMAGVLWDVMGMQWPYLVAAAIAGLAALWALRLRQPPREPKPSYSTDLPIP